MPGTPGSVPRDMLLAALTNSSVPPNLILVAKLVNADLQAAFDLGSESLAAP